MMTRQELEGHWNEVRGSLREKWAELRADELDAAYGDMEQLLSTVQQRTGRSRSEVENFIEEVIAEGTDKTESASGHLRDYAEDVRHQADEYAREAADYARQQYAQASERMHEGREHVEGMVRRNPLESVAVTFGAGLIAGVVIGLATGRRS